MAPTKPWESILGELELQMTKATFNTHLKNSRGRLVGEVLTVELASEYALSWVEGRLHDTIVRTAESILLFAPLMEYAIRTADESKPAPRRVPEDLGTYIPGVILHDKRFLRCPLFLPDVVGPQGSGAAVKLYIQILKHTVGYYDEDTRAYGREWWENLTIAYLVTAVGISRNSVEPAIRECREKGWAKWHVTAEKPKRFNLALREEGEPVDWG
jgi:hypothetical protein